jgi:hypothetical protein
MQRMWSYGAVQFYSVYLDRVIRRMSVVGAPTRASSNRSDFGNRARLRSTSTGPADRVHCVVQKKRVCKGYKSSPAQSVRVAEINWKCIPNTSRCWRNCMICVNIGRLVVLHNWILQPEVNRYRCVTRGLTALSVSVLSLSTSSN